MKRLILSLAALAGVLAFAGSADAAGVARFRAGGIGRAGVAVQRSRVVVRAPVVAVQRQRIVQRNLSANYRLEGLALRSRSAFVGGYGSYGVSAFARQRFVGASYGYGAQAFVSRRYVAPIYAQSFAVQSYAAPVYAQSFAVQTYVQPVVQVQAAVAVPVYQFQPLATVQAVAAGCAAYGTGCGY